MGRTRLKRGKGMRLLITGASGFVGSHLCHKLVADNHEVWGISRLTQTEKVAAIQNRQDFHLLKCDITDFDKVRSVFAKNKFDAILHTAACLTAQPPDNPIPYLATNVNGTLNILEAARLEQNAEKVIYSSSMSVYGVAKHLPVAENHPTKPTNIYGLTKLMGEMLCQFYARQYNFKVTVLRYSGIFGPGKDGGAIYNFIKAAVNNAAPTIFSDGSDIWDTLYVKDVVTANILALKNIDRRGFEIFNIGMGEGINVTEAANKIVRLAGSTVAPSLGTAPALPAFYYDIANASNMLGFTPTPFDEGVREYIAWERSKSLTAK